MSECTCHLILGQANLVSVCPFHYGLWLGEKVDYGCMTDKKTAEEKFGVDVENLK